jgi:hypothetical protein
MGWQVANPEPVAEIYYCGQTGLWSTWVDVAAVAGRSVSDFVLKLLEQEDTEKPR